MGKERLCENLNNAKDHATNDHIVDYYQKEKKDEQKKSWMLNKMYYLSLRC